MVLLLLNVVLNHYSKLRDKLENVLSGESIDKPVESNEISSLVHEKDRTLIAERLHAENNLQNAFEQGDLELFYQPIISLEDNKIAGCESLIRWRDAERGLIPPCEFIGLSEEMGLIVPIGLWCIEQACRSYKRFNELINLNSFFVSVNLSGRQFESTGLAADVKEIFDESEIDPARIKFEITESILMANPSLTASTLYEFKEMGVMIAIDDFGTGYSSFSYLHRFPIDSIKIDRAFISTMIDNPKSYEIVRTLCLLADSLNMIVIAEGIEQDSENNSLRDLEAEFGQGYLYSKPLPEKEFI